MIQIPSKRDKMEMTKEFQTKDGGGVNIDTNYFT